MLWYVQTRTGDPFCRGMVRNAKILLLGIRKKLELETESDFEIQDSESEDNILLESKASGTSTGTVNENVEAIVIDDNQVILQIHERKI